jgi:hypothetical protein
MAGAMTAQLSGLTLGGGRTQVRRDTDTRRPRSGGFRAPRDCLPLHVQKRSREIWED